MKMKLRVDCNGMFFDGGAIVEVPEFIHQCFEPARSCDDAAMCFINGGLPAESQELKKVIKVRENAAKDLADHLASMIVAEMSKNDTHNGYPK